MRLISEAAILKIIEEIDVSAIGLSEAQKPA